MDVEVPVRPPHGREVALGPIGYRAWSAGVEVSSDVDGGRRVNRCTSPRYDYSETEGERPEVVLKEVGR